ncbi:hypothetical protein [Pseudomonas viridiflava]|uniref:hypothetical protein n=1 Tax=Pseudomonas viridiflava TaxID=33069 RepID=UPI00107016A3|nr:hypothetical protein [Pseudomonas viridiflava]
MTEKTLDPKHSPTEAAHHLAVELVRSSGEALFKDRSVSRENGQKAADFVIAFEEKITAYYRSLK